MRGRPGGRRACREDEGLSIERLGQEVEGFEGVVGQLDGSEGSGCLGCGLGDRAILDRPVHAEDIAARVDVAPLEGLPLLKA
jgi:hypothetical protein